MRSYRGVEVNINAIAKSQSSNMALGNSSQNGRGDIVKNGKIVQTYEERVKEFVECNTFQKATINLKSDGSDDNISNDELPSKDIPEKDLTLEAIMGSKSSRKSKSKEQ